MEMDKVTSGDGGVNLNQLKTGPVGGTRYSSYSELKKSDPLMAKKLIQMIGNVTREDIIRQLKPQVEQFCREHPVTQDDIVNAYKSGKLTLGEAVDAIIGNEVVDVDIGLKILSSLIK
jgi:hypothetical protein